MPTTDQILTIIWHARTKPMLAIAALDLLVICAISFCSSGLHAGPPDVPLATARDIEFLVEYSTDNLALGDVLYARAVLRNKSAQTVRFADEDTLVVFAQSNVAKELVCGFGEFGSGYPLHALAPGQQIQYTRMLDVFGNDGREDGEFNPFDTSLNKTPLLLKASRGTVMPHQYKLDYLAYQLESKHEIRFGRPLLEKSDFDESVESELKRDDLNPLTLTFFSPEIQTSYLFSRAENRRDYNEDPRILAACLRVLSRELPHDSSARRLASTILEINRFVEASDSATEDQAMSGILLTLAGGSPIERQYWISRLATTLESGSKSQVNKDGKLVYLVTEEKYESFLEYLDEAGVLPVNELNSLGQ